MAENWETFEGMMNADEEQLLSAGDEDDDCEAINPVLNGGADKKAEKGGKIKAFLIANYGKILYTYARIISLSQSSITIVISTFISNSLIPEHIVPRLTRNAQQEKLSYKQSSAIVLSLYLSHIFSAWVRKLAPRSINIPPVITSFLTSSGIQGDRMWMFIVSLFFAQLYPGSLLMPAVHGFITGLFVALFGTIAGDWVDINPRMRGKSDTRLVCTPITLFTQ